MIDSNEPLESVSGSHRWIDPKSPANNAEIAMKQGSFHHFRAGVMQR
jgi:hypothetical protein